MSRRLHRPPGQGSGKLIRGESVGGPLRPQIGGRDRDSRGDVRACDLRQQTHRVVAERRRVFVARPVVVVHRVRRHAGAAVALQLERHRAAEQRRFAPDHRVVVGIDRVRHRRHGHPRTVASHLVHAEKDLRVPLGVEEARQIAALRQVHHERVAVDVVTRVPVIEPRHRLRLQTVYPSFARTNRRPGVARPG